MWITCSTVGCKPGEVNVFDSMLGNDLPDGTKVQIAPLLCTSQKQIVSLYLILRCRYAFALPEFHCVS